MSALKWLFYGYQVMQNDFSSRYYSLSYAPQLLRSLPYQTGDLQVPPKLRVQILLYHMPLTLLCHNSYHDPQHTKMMPKISCLNIFVKNLLSQPIR